MNVFGRIDSDYTPKFVLSFSNPLDFTFGTCTGFLMPRTIHTVSVEELDEHVKCKTACRIEVQLNCSESSRKECPDVWRTAARSAVAFEDLATGDYILTTTCTDAEHACHAGKQILFSDKLSRDVDCFFKSFEVLVVL